MSSNVANLSTAGYKRRISFADINTAGSAGDAPDAGVRSRPDLVAGKLSDTGNPLDLAIDGNGFFQVRNGQDLVYTRNGQFHLAEDGRLTTVQGFPLQQAGGGDVVLDRSAVEVRADGTIMDGDRPIARIGVFAPPVPSSVKALDGSIFHFDGDPQEVGDAGIRQGMIEASNVSVGDEMVTMMAALRQAESGARLVQTYDDLLGRAISAFGQGGR